MTMNIEVLLKSTKKISQFINVLGNVDSLEENNWQF